MRSVFSGLFLAVLLASAAVPCPLLAGRAGRTPSAGSQSASAAQAPAFEVASIKRSAADSGGGGGGPRGDRFTMRNVPVLTSILYAFRPAGGQLLNQQIVGGPDWMRSDHYDIDARMPGAVTDSASHEQVQRMVQTLLEVRFGLKWHRETRELPVYHLTVGSGVKMRQSPDQTPPDPLQGAIFFGSLDDRGKPLARGQIRLSTGPDESALTGSAVTIARLVTLLQGQADRMVFDETHLSALYDFDIEFGSAAAPPATTDAARPDAAAPAPSLFTAIAGLGLRLQPAKAPLPVIVIDSITRPTEN